MLLGPLVHTRPCGVYHLGIPSGVFEPSCCSLYHRKRNILELYLVSILSVTSPKWPLNNEKRCEGKGILTWLIQGCGKRTKWSQLKGGCDTERLQKSGTRAASADDISLRAEGKLGSPELTIRPNTSFSFSVPHYLLFTLFPIASLLFLKHALASGHFTCWSPWTILPPKPTLLVFESVCRWGHYWPFYLKLLQLSLYLPCFIFLYSIDRHLTSCFIFCLLSAASQNMNHLRIYILFCSLVYYQHPEQWLTCTGLHNYL